MRQFLLTTTLICLSSVAVAQEQENDGSGFSLMERGARDFFDGMKKEMAPALEGLGECWCQSDALGKEGYRAGAGSRQT